MSENSNESLKQKTKKGLYWKLFDQSANQIMQFVVGIVMARLLSPEDYGITALPAVFMAVAGIFMDSGFGQALVRKPNLTEKDLSTSFYYSIGMGVFMYVVMFFMAPLIAVFYDTPVLTSLIRVTALNFLWGPLGTPQGVILQRRLDFKTPARISIVNKIVSAIVGISVAYAGFGLWALVASGLTASLLGLVQKWLVIKWLPTESFNKDSFKYLWNYGNKMIGANLIDVLYNNVTPVFVGKYYSPRDLGVYNRALGYSVLPANTITGLLIGVTFPVLCQIQNDDETLRRNYRRMINVACFVAFPIFMLLCALARPLVIVLITDKWIECVVLLQIMCFAKMWWPIQSINRNLLQVKGRSDLYLKVEVYKKAINFVLLCVSLPFGMVVFCSAEIIQSLQSLFWNTHYTGKLINLSVWKQLGDVMPMFGLSMLMFVSVLGVNYFISNVWFQLFAGVCVGAIVYVGGAYLLKFDEINDVKYMLSRKATVR